MTSIHDQAALEELRRQARLDPNALRHLRNAFYKNHTPTADALRDLPAPARGLFAGVAFHFLTLHHRIDSEHDGATKLLFRTFGRALIESVILRIASGRTSLCISSQVGCAARCVFCATGHMGVALPLTRDQILDQVIQANRMLAFERRSVRNVVFMGMGEPLHNEVEVYAALETMLSPRCFAFSPKRILVSTVGIPEAMVRCAIRFPQVRMALSLHSARQEVRARLIPLARRYSLDELQTAIVEVTGIQRQPLMIEYLLLDGLNDTEEDVHALAHYLRNLPIHLNLIPYNAIDEAPGLRGTPPAGVRRFAAALSSAGFPVTVRYSLGADIAAACGQLARKEDRAAQPG